MNANKPKLNIPTYGAWTPQAQRQELSGVHRAFTSMMVMQCAAPRRAVGLGHGCWG